MTGFKPQTSAVGSDRSTNWATITAQMLVLFYIKFLWGSPKVAAVVRANNISTGSLVRTNDVTRRGRKKSFRPHFFVQQKLWKLVSTKIPFLTSPHCVWLGPIISTCPGMREREMENWYEKEWENTHYWGKYPCMTGLQFFKRMCHPRPLFHLLSPFETNVHLVYGARIQTLDL